MKQVTIDNVRERIAELEMVNSHGELSLRGEFELACLRMLEASMEAKPVVYSLIFRNMEGKLYDYVNVNTTFATLEEAQAYGKGGRYVTQGDGSIKWVADPSLDPVVVPLYTAPPAQVTGVDDDVRNVVGLLENNEWAEHCTKTELGKRMESEITRLHNWLSAQPSPVIYNIGEATMLHIFTATGMTDVSDMQAVFDRVEEVLVKLERKPKVIEPEGWRDMMTRLANGLELMTSLASERAISVDTCVCLEWVRDARTMLNQAQEPVTDNTAQQFEALANSSKSEHLLNSERIAREAQTLSDRLNVTSVVHDRVSGWSERQQKVIAYSLWRFSYTAHQQANQAAQANNKDMFDRFIRDARCAEEIREEFTSAWGCKP